MHEKEEKVFPKSKIILSTIDFCDFLNFRLLDNDINIPDRIQNMQFHFKSDK